MRTEISKKWLDYVVQISFNYNNYVLLQDKLNTYFKSIYGEEKIDSLIFLNFIQNNFMKEEIIPLNLDEISIKNINLFLSKILKPSMKSEAKIDLLNVMECEEAVKTILLKIIFLYENEEITTITDVKKLKKLNFFFNYESGNFEDKIYQYQLNKHFFKELKKYGVIETGIVVTDFLNSINLTQQMENPPFNKLSSSLQVNKEKMKIELKEEVTQPQISPIELKIIKKKRKNLIQLKKRSKSKHLNLIQLTEKENNLTIKENLNIFFKGNYNNRVIGVPSTGKSFFLNEYLEEQTGIPPVNIYKISIEKGINGTNSNRLILGYGYKKGKAIDKKGIVLSIIEKAISNPYEQYVINLEDIHNQSIDDLLSPLTAITKNQDRFELSLFFNIVKKYIEEPMIKDIFKAHNIKYKKDVIKYANKRNLIHFIKEVIIFLKDIKNVTLGNIVTIQLPQIIESRKEDNIYFIPNNLYINMTSNYGENSVLPIEWEDRITSQVFKPYKKKQDFANFLNDNIEESASITNFINIFLEINKLLEEKLYDIEYVEPWNLLIGHYVIIHNNIITSNKKEQVVIIKKIIQTIHNNCKSENIYNYQEIILHIISNLTHFKLINEFLTSSTLNFEKYKEIEDWNVIEKSEQNRIKKELYKIIT